VNLERQFSAEAINKIINNPLVRPDVADLQDGLLDLTSAIADKNNVLLMGKHGGNMFYRMMPGIYEVHTVADKAGRGQWIHDFVRQAAQYMFTKTDCYEITTRIPRKHYGARQLAESVGMTYEFSIEDGCVWRGEKQTIDIYSYRIQDWIKQAYELESVGELFHEKLHREAHGLGITDAGHPPWPVHDRYVGAVWEMAKAGQIAKGCAFYNRWAQAARHSTIRLVSIDPPQIAMDLGILTLKGDDIEVRECAENMITKIAS